MSNARDGRGEVPYSGNSPFVPGIVQRVPTIPQPDVQQAPALGFGYQSFPLPVNRGSINSAEPTEVPELFPTERDPLIDQRPPPLDMRDDVNDENLPTLATSTSGESSGCCSCCACSCGFPCFIRHGSAFGYAIQNGFIYVDPHTWFFRQCGLINSPTGIEFTNPWFYFAIAIGVAIFIGNEGAYLNHMSALLKRLGLEEKINKEALKRSFQDLRQQCDTPRAALWQAIVLLATLLKMTGSLISTWRFASAISMALSGTPIPGIVFACVTSIFNLIANYSIISKGKAKQEPAEAQEMQQMGDAEQQATERFLGGQTQHLRQRQAQPVSGANLLLDLNADALPCEETPDGVPPRATMGDEVDDFVTGFSQSGSWQ